MTDPISTNDVSDVIPQQERTSPVTDTLPNAQENQAMTKATSTNETTPPIGPASERTTTPLTEPTAERTTTPPIEPAAERAPTLATPMPMASSSSLASTSLAAITGRRPNSNDLPKIQTLSRELWDIRRKLTAEGVRESVIVDKLKLLNAAYVPEPMSASSDRALRTFPSLSST